MRPCALALTAVAVLCACLSTVSAQDWPSRPVKIISPFAPGGSSDTVARIIGDQLTQKFGQQFVVENRPGASGLIGSASVANAEPDGYTYLVASIGTHVIAPATNANAGFDPIRGFSHVVYLGGPPNVIVAHPSLGVKTFTELTALLKTRTEPLSYVSPGPGTVGNLFAELWAKKEGIKLSHIAYRGSGQAMNDLVAGHVKMGSITWTGALGQIRAGAVVPLAVSSRRRMPEFLDVPTMTELGHPDLVATTWFGFVGPAGVSGPVVARLHAGVQEALQSEALRKRFESEGIESQAMTPQDFTTFIESEIAKWAPIARAAISQPATR